MTTAARCAEPSSESSTRWSSDSGRTPQYSAPFVDADVAAAMHDLIVGNGSRLRAAAAWFELLKRERRRLRITTGNAQELYFPVCFELAVTKGRARRTRITTRQRPCCATSTTTATAPRSRCSTSSCADQQVIAKLSEQLRRSWRDVRAGAEITGPFLAGLTTVLGPADSHRDTVARQRVWSALIADATPYNLGAKAHDTTTELPWSIVELGSEFG